MRARLATVLCTFSALASCATPRPVTEMVITVDADAVVRAGVVELDVEVFGGPDPARLPSESLAAFPYNAGSGPIFPKTIVLFPEGQDPARGYRVVATATLGDGRTVVAQLRSGYVGGRSLRFRLFLRAQCIDVPCGADDTCSDGECVPAYVDPLLLVPGANDASDGMDAAGPDAPGGMDAAGPDAPGGMDAPSAPDAAGPDAPGGMDASDAGLDAPGGMDMDTPSAPDAAGPDASGGMDTPSAPDAAGPDASGGMDTPSAPDAGPDAGSCAGRGRGVECRARVDLCDVAEQCDGISPDCPADRFMPSTTMCRGAFGGPCDAEEYCTGASAQCPADAFQPASVPGSCREGSNLCDPGGRCTGESAECVSVPAIRGTLCRTDYLGPCDAVEYCDGVSFDCPADLVRPSGALCEVSGGGAGTCNGADPFCHPGDAGMGAPSDGGLGGSTEVDGGGSSDQGQTEGPPI